MMSSPRMRPEFEIPIEADVSDVLANLKSALDDETCVCGGKVFRNEAVLWIREAERHFWSPFLYVRFVLSEDAEGQSRKLWGRFAPHPDVWTMFMGMYGVLLMCGIGGLVFGISQHMTNATPWAYAIVPLSMLAAAFVYGAAFIGQSLGAEQMYQLRRFLEQSMLQSRGL